MVMHPEQTSARTMGLWTRLRARGIRPRNGRRTGQGMLRQARLLVCGLAAGLALSVNAGAAWAYSQTVALVISNTDYQQTDDVAYAERDAQAFVDFATDVLNARVVHLKDLGTNAMNELFGDAQRLGSIRNYVNAPDTDLYVYYAGHGTHDAPASGPAKNYLLPVDANPDQSFLARQAYAIDDLRNSLQRLQQDAMPDGRITLVLESCFSGLNPSNDGSAKGLLPGVSAPPLGKAVELELQDIRLWAATSPDTDFAVWDDRFERGVFTDALLSALHGGAADADKDFKITASELQAYVSRRVNQQVASLTQAGLGFRQRPTFTGMDDEDVIVTYPAEIYPTYATDEQRRYEEDFVAFELLDKTMPHLASSDPTQLTDLVDEVRDFTATCQFCQGNQKLFQRMNQLRQRLQTCRAEQRLLTRIVEQKRIKSLQRLAGRLECGYGAAAIQACVSTGDFNSSACQCLGDEQCVAQSEDLTPRCDGELAKISDQPVSVQGALYASFTRDHPECGIIESKAKTALAAFCQTQASLAGLGSDSATVAALTGFVASYSYCERAVTQAEQQIAALETELQEDVCETDFQAVALSNDPDRLSGFIATHPSCPVQLAEAQIILGDLNERLGQCQQAYLEAVVSEDVDVLDAFVRDYAMCSNEVAVIEQRIEGLEHQYERTEEANACMAIAEQRLPVNQEEGFAVLEECSVVFADIPGITERADQLRETFVGGCDQIDLGNECVTPHQAYVIVQQHLKAAGCYTGAIDGDFGPKSRKALGTYNKATGANLNVSSDAALVQAINWLGSSAGVVCQREAHLDYSKRRDIDLSRHANDIYEKGLRVGVAECAQQCNALGDGCIGFAYVTKKSTKYARCWPKSDFGNRHKISVVDFYIKPGVKDTSVWPKTSSPKSKSGTFSFGSGKATFSFGSKH